MDEGQMINLGRQAILISLQLTMPIMLMTLVVGVIISLLQAVTQIQEQTLSFVPKILVFVAALALLGPWMLHSAVVFMGQMFARLPSVLGQ